MTIYYIKQDDTVPGCGDPGCCGEYYEEISESFVDCRCEQVEPNVEPDMAGHLQSCNGGGPVLKWRKAKAKEILAFEAGKSEGHSEGWHDGIEWHKNKEAKLFKQNRDMTVHQLVHDGYVVTLDGSKINKAIEKYSNEESYIVHPPERFRDKAQGE